MTFIEVSSRPSTADSRVFTIEAATQKFDSREDLVRFVQPLIDATHVEEVHLSGNTYSIEACKFLGEILATKKSLKVVISVSPLTLGRAVCRYLFNASPLGNSTVSFVPA
jgi:Ran GTPase-activating protein (RanGAP) involved in mRNA processing and transport